MATFETDKGLVRQGLAWINTMVDLGILTDSVVAAANTVAGLKTALNDAAVPETSKRFVDEATRDDGSIDRSVNIGILSNAIILPLTTVAGLRALFTDADDTLTATDRYSQVA